MTSQRDKSNPMEVFPCPASQKSLQSLSPRIRRSTRQPAIASGEFLIGGDLPIYRLGFGTMQLTGKGVWGEPRDHAEAIAGLAARRRAWHQSSRHSRFLWARGRRASDRRSVASVSCRPGHRHEGWLPAAWARQMGRRWPARASSLGLRREPEAAEARSDRSVPTPPDRSQGADGGSDRHAAGFAARGKNPAHRACRKSKSRRSKPSAGWRRSSRCRTGTTWRTEAPRTCWIIAPARSIGFIPWFPLATGNLAKADGPLTRAAERLRALPAQVAFAWLLKKSPVMLPIPGTSQVAHLEENTAAALLDLDDSIMRELDRIRA